MGGTGGGRWSVELSQRAVDALRALPRSEQREVARRIDQIESGGPPPGAGPDGPVELPAGPHVLVCAVRRGAERRVVVITLVPREATAPTAVGHLALRRLKRLTGGGVMDGMRELGYAARGLRKAPGFTLAAVLTLALGIGASAAVFSVANGVLLEPLPYDEPDEVVTIWSQWAGFPKTWVSEPEYVNYWQQNRTLEDVALYFTSTHTFTSVDNPEMVGSGVVTPNTFAVLGVDPLAGRAFTWEEAQGMAQVVMLGHDVWQRRFNGDPGMVGRDVQVNGQAFTVVGILPEGFVLPVDYGSAAPSEVFFTSPVDRDRDLQVPPNGGSHGYFAAARLRPGVTVAEARTDLETISGRLAAEGVYQPSWNFRPLVQNVKDDIVGDTRATILFLLGACGFVLLIACGNVANLILSRSEGRIHDVAVRRALGAGQGEILRGLFFESVLLASAGGALGLALAAFGIDALLAIDPEAVPRASSVALDGTVVAFTVVVSAATAVLFGWIPALRVGRSGVADSLHSAGRDGGRGARANRTQGLLVASQMAMAVALLAAAGLTMRTFVALTSIDLGFRTEEVLTARLTVPAAGYPNMEDVTGFWDELLRQVRETPGVSVAGAGRLLPLDSQMGDSGFYPDGYEVADGESMAAEWQYVSSDYIEALGIPLLAGRSFDERDASEGQTAMMVNQAAVDRFWSGRDPLGTRVATFGGDTAVVVGVVGNLRHNGVTASIKPRYYRSLHQLNGPGNIRRMTLTLKADGQAEELVAPLRSIVRAMDPTMPLSRVQTLEEVASDALAAPRFAMVLLGVFAVVALTLAVIGIYGVLAYAVGRRTREIGVRMALGAARGTVVGMVVKQGMRMALLGVVIGTGAAFGLTRFMEGMLYGVAPQDPVTFLTVPMLFVGVALLACWLPAARAARVPPTEALRGE